MSWLAGLGGRRTPKSVTIASSQRRFEVGKNETILERALKENIAYPHDCTVGTCGSCRSKLLSGKVSAITPFSYTLSADELAAGYILACQAVPTSDVVVDFEAGDQARAPAPVKTGGRITHSEDLTHDIKRVTWETAEPLSFVAGQYMNVTWCGAPGHRSYSFCDAPTPQGSRRLRTIIRRVAGGAFTEMLFSGAARDVEFGIEAPHGGFWLRKTAAPILCVAGGSGLSPLLSILHDAKAQDVGRDVVLLFGARTLRDLYCLDEIADIAGQWRGRFKFWPALSEQETAGHRAGLVTAHIAEALSELGGGAHGYLCGPPPMVDAAIHALAEASVPLGDIHYDKFTDASTRAANS